MLLFVCSFRNDNKLASNTFYTKELNRKLNKLLLLYTTTNCKNNIQRVFKLFKVETI